MKLAYLRYVLGLSAFFLVLTNSPGILYGQALTVPNNGGGNPFYLWAYGNTESTSHMRIGTDYGHQGDAAIEIFQYYTNPTPPQPGRVIVNGNLGVGTLYPSERLAVNGNIKAREVNVSTSGWADFVFDPDFNLMPISELKSFIKEKRHLPNIPTEEEVMDKGIWLSEMNVKLLQKVEELTLYIIQQDDQIRELQSRNQELGSLAEKLFQLEQRLKKLESTK